MSESIGMTLLPAAKGTCHFCACEHSELDPHNWWSLFYQVRFKMAHGRDATHADAIAHLEVERQTLYQRAIEHRGIPFTSPDGEPVNEPYVESTGDTLRSIIVDMED